MARYIAIIDYDAESGLYGASFPDAPGCTAMGEMEDEVVVNATEALSEWAADEAADGRQIGPARSYAQLLESGELPELGRNGMIATIPLVVETGRLTRANISMDAGVLAAIDAEAARRGMTRSAFLSSAARDKIRGGV